MDFATAQASPFFVAEPYDFIRNRMVTDAMDDGPDDAIVVSLPAFANFTATLPTNSSLNGAMLSTKANMKAIGIANLDTFFGPSDGTITFNANRDFDYDSSDGVGRRYHA